MYYELLDQFDVRASPEKSWEFFANPENLPRCTPGWVGFTVLTPSPIDVHEGALIDYRIHWFGLQIHWRSLICEYDLLRLLTYIQVEGPYSVWVHRHRFERLENGGTRILDRVVYRLPGGPIGRMMHSAVVSRQLKDIFLHRHGVVDNHLGLSRLLDGGLVIRKIA